MMRMTVALLTVAALVVGCTPPPKSVTSQVPPVAAQATDGSRVSGKPHLQPGTPFLERSWTGDAQKFSFAIIGDKTSGDARGWPTFDRAVDEINLLHPDFALTVGDHVQGYTEDSLTIVSQWQEYWEHAGRLMAPLFILPGNHDVTTPILFRWWEREVGRPYYSFNYMGCHFVALNTEQERFTGRWGFGDEQVDWVLDDLARNRTARHTFVLMHKPAWSERGNSQRDWERIERALGDRPYMVFAGHTHCLQFDVRNGRRYLVVGPTGAGLEPSEVREIGRFHHYTWATVDGDSVSLSLIEPGGPMWPQDIATRQFSEAAYRLVAVDAHLPQTSRAGELTTGFVTTVDNRLPDTASVTLTLTGLGSEGWSLTRGNESTTVVVPPGASQQIDLAFVTREEHLRDRPLVRAATRYGGKRLAAWQRRAPLFPDSVMKSVTPWELVGPFAGGPYAADADDPRAAMPWLFEVRGPENGWTAGATFRAGSEERTWRTIEANPDGSLDLGPALGVPKESVAYALCGIEAPTARTVYGALVVDDYAQVLVNGVPAEGGQVYRSGREPAFVPLSLRAGWNTVIVKVINGGGSWGFGFRVGDSQGDLRFAQHPQ